MLLVAHGSRREAANDEMRRLVKKLETMSHPFAGIACAFLEIAKPSIQEALQQFIVKDANAIVVLPCFLSAGRHVTADIPEQVEQVKNQYPDVQITVANYLGASEMMVELIMRQALGSSAD